MSTEKAENYKQNKHVMAEKEWENMPKLKWMHLSESAIGNQQQGENSQKNEKPNSV